MADGDTRKELYVVGYSGLAPAYEALERAFQKTPLGKGVTFHNSFGPSGDQIRAIADGRPASIVDLERTGEMERLVEVGVVDAGWDELPIFYGRAHWTTVVYVVRSGNPKHVHAFRDLLRDDVDVIVPNPFSSDTGRWSVMQAYVTLSEEGKSEADALAGIERLLEKAVSQPAGAAEALSGFLRGEGDVLLTYESDAIQAIEANKNLSFIVPEPTVYVDTTVAVTREAVQPAGRHFLKFFRSGTAQNIWAEAGYRPADQSFQARYEERFPYYEVLNIHPLGDWAKLDEEFFDEQTGSVTRIERELGIPTTG